MPFKVAPVPLTPEAAPVVALGADCANTGAGDNPIIKFNMKISTEAIVISLLIVSLHTSSFVE